jgi:hypothetical protein
MRLRSLFLLSFGLLLHAAPLRAQVTDSQRAAARDLFKEGDLLQRSGKLVEALDKFQRAQAVFDAPTNLLRIAECEAALGRLVESAEAFRAVLRAPLPAGSAPAFQAAVDQARAELAQVEPRVPKLVVDVQPPKVDKLQLQIDGQNVAAALVGASLPLDPGTHRVSVGAPGYATAEQQVILKEQESKTASFTLRAAPASATGTQGTAAAGAAGASATGAAATAGGSGASSSPGATSDSSGAPPPPPPVVDATLAPPPKPRPAFQLGAHVGWSFPTGQVPLGGASNADARVVSNSGLALGLDGGIRFARQWYGGVTLEHAELGAGSGNGLDKVNGIPTGVTGAKASTTEVGAIIGVITNPDRPSFYGHVGVAARWLNVSFAGGPSPTYTSAEAILGAGVWLPGGRHLRLVPEATLNLGTYSAPSGASALDPSGSTSNGPPGHVYVMVGVVGFYCVDL